MWVYFPKCYSFMHSAVHSRLDHTNIVWSLEKSSFMLYTTFLYGFTSSLIFVCISMAVCFKRLWWRLNKHHPSPPARKSLQGCLEEVRKLSSSLLLTRKSERVRRKPSVIPLCHFVYNKNLCYKIIEWGDSSFQIIFPPTNKQSMRSVTASKWLFTVLESKWSFSTKAAINNIC